MTQSHQSAWAAARRAATLGFGVVLLALGTGCSSSLAQPFEQLKQNGAQITMYRLQNYEPPATQQGASVSSILPPQVQTWLNSATSLLPPGLLQGLLPGVGATAAPQETQVARFHGHRVLAWQNIGDSSLVKEVYDVFGKKGNFDSPRTSAFYPEFGFAFMMNGQPQHDIVVSASCDQIQAFNFAWPYEANTGMSKRTNERIIEIAKRAFPN